MKKGIIAFSLAAALTSGSIGTASVLAAEITAEEVVTAQEERMDEEETTPEENGGTASEDDEPILEDDRIIIECEPENDRSGLADTILVDEISDVEEDSENLAHEEEYYEEISEFSATVEIEEEIESSEENNSALAGDIVDSGECGSDVSWQLTGSGDDLTLTISGNGDMKDYEESNTPWFSYRAKIKTLIIEDGVTHIGEYAFSFFNKVTKMLLPDTITTIGYCSFENCTSLKSITIPDSVRSISGAAFEGCVNLEEIHINSLTAWLNLSRYYTESSFDLYVNDDLLTDVIIPDGVQAIEDNAFIGCRNIKKVTIPDSVTSIGDYAFKNCSNLTSIEIPEGMITIGESAFSGCKNLRTIVIPNSVVTEIKDGTFYNCISLTKVTIGNNVPGIGEFAFYDCRCLTDIVIPNSVESIGLDAFCKCISLKSITIPDNVKSIGAEAFCGCSNLTSVDIPFGVIEIGAYAFENCGRLKTITIADSVISVGRKAFGEEGERTVMIRFRGTKAQWDNAVGSNKVYYSSIVYNCFNVPVTVNMSGTVFSYTGNEIKPTIAVMDQGRYLKEGVDYELVYKNCIAPGIATVIVNGIGDYSGAESSTYKILPGATKKVTCTNVASGMKVSWEKVAGATRYKVYRDNKLVFTTSALEVTDKEVKSRSGTKFTYKVVALEKNAGDSKQYRTAQYYRLMPVGILSITNSYAGKMTVKYDWCNGGSGYVVRYGLKSDMSDAKVITVKGSDTTERTFGGMQKGKTYYVQVRTYKIDNGVRYYSGYCTTKTVKIIR